MSQFYLFYSSFEANDAFWYSFLNRILCVSEIEAQRMSELFRTLMDQEEVKCSDNFRRLFTVSKTDSISDMHLAWSILDKALDCRRLALVDIILEPRFGIDMRMPKNEFISIRRSSFPHIDEACFKKLIQHGLNVNTSYLQNVTFLAAVCCCENKVIFDALLERGADIDATNDYHAPPLIAAIRRSFIYGVHRLLAAGVDLLKCQPDTGRTPLEVAYILVMHGDRDYSAARRVFIALLSQETLRNNYPYCNTPDEIASEEEIIHKLRLEICKRRVSSMLMAMQGWRMAVPCLIAIVDFYWSGARRLPYHLKWNIVCSVRHFHQQ